jgi:hypothetical protein
MSALEALRAACAAGIELPVKDDDLALSAASEPPAAVLRVTTVIRLVRRSAALRDTEPLRVWESEDGN